MHILTKFIFGASRTRKIVRNFLLILGMSLTLISPLIWPGRASEIFAIFGCTDAFLMPPGGFAAGALCTGVAGCLSSDNRIAIMTATCWENAYCPWSWVLDDVIVDATPTRMRCRGTGVDVPSGLIVHVLFTTDGCDPGDVPFELRIPTFFNCSFPLPADVCFANGGFWDYALSSCSSTPTTQSQCDMAAWFWNPISDYCQSEAPPPCYLEPEICSPGSWSFTWCGCTPDASPIVIDVLGNGFDLTSAQNGVVFNLNNIGGSEKIAWTKVGSDDAWLVLDRNNNGTIDNGTEMFGDVTPQPEPPAGAEKNGFLALAEFDKPDNGGNGDGLISKSDSVFSSLRLWQDVNKNGVSEPSELHSLKSLGLKTIELDFKESKRTDQHGNKFKYRAKVKDNKDAQMGRWAWDVWLARTR